VGTCANCQREVPINPKKICRLCWTNASGSRGADKSSFDPITANRNGQQLSFAGMVWAARSGKQLAVPPSAPALPRPVSHRQLVLFVMEPDLGCGFDRLPRPRATELAAALDVFARNYCLEQGWSKRHNWRIPAGIRVLLGLQDTPGAPITITEVELLPQLKLPIRPVCEVLAAAGMLEDDRTPAIVGWFDAKIAELPRAMVEELLVWFDIMLRGSTTAPRRHPRNEVTIRLYATWAMPVLTASAVADHTSLREISHAEVLDLLPAEGTPRACTCRALRSIFQILRARKLVFTDPTARIHVWVSSGTEPLPVDIEIVRAALTSPHPPRAAIAALVIFHGLRSADLSGLQLTDVRDGRLYIGTRVIVLADVVLTRIRAYLDHRVARWPNSPNPHLFIHFRSASRSEPVGRRWLKLTLEVPGGVQALREDRILNEAQASQGDARRLHDLFGLSIQGALRYTDTVDHPGLLGNLT
jgi:hypothetical protein